MIERLPAPGLLADVLLIVHAAIVAFVILGLVLTLIGGWLRWGWIRNPWFRLAHLGTIGFVVIQTWLGALCPLTIWEQELRRADGQPGHDQAFVEYWISRWLYWDFDWWVFVAGYTGFALAVLATYWYFPPRSFRTRAETRGNDQ